MSRALIKGSIAALLVTLSAVPVLGQEASYYFAIAKMYAGEGSYGEAVDAFLKAIELEPEDPYIRMEYAELLGQTGRSRQAAEVATEALELAPDNPDALRLAANVRLELASRDARSLRLARDAFEKLRELEPGDVQSLLTLARIYLSQNNASGALEVLEEASSYSPNHPAVHRAVLEALVGSGDDDKALELLPDILLRDPSFQAGRLALARVHSDRGDHAAAIEVLERAPSDGGSTDLDYLLASELYRRAAGGGVPRATAQADLERARDLVRSILAEQPTHLEAQYLSGLVLGEQGERGAAIEQLQSLYEIAPHDLRLRVGTKLSQLLEQDDRVAEAAALLSDLAREQMEAGSRTEMADRVLFEVARLHARHEEWGELAEAAQTLMGASEEALRLEGVLLYAEALHRKGESRAAVQHLRRQAGNFEDPTRIELQRAEIQDEIGDRSESARTLGRLVERGDVPSLLAVAQFHLQRDNDRAVVPVLERLLAKETGEVDPAMRREILFLLSDSLLNLDRAEEALDRLAQEARSPADEDGELDRRRMVLKRAEILEALGRADEASTILDDLGAAPDRQAALLLVQYYQRQTRFDAMIPVLERALQQGDGESAALDVDLYFSLGMAYERTGNFGQADAAFREVLELDPDDGRTLNYLGYMWAEKGEKLEEALGMIERAVAMEPDNPAYVDSLGWAHFQLGNYDRARDHLEYAARLLPDDATILEHLGDLYVAIEATEKAVELYRRALARDEENVEGVRRKLAELGAGGS